MTQARVPNDEHNWDAIDIFLFSNGQQYSPPRKYHLQGEKLNLWDDTLHYLAKSQLGSKHSVVHLYSLQGRRIDGPLDLSNRTAYVAVASKDAFIDTGYDKYLIKATRSWEKRQARKSNTNGTKTDINNADENLTIFTNSDEVDLRSIKPPEENFTTESVVDPFLSTILKPQRLSQQEQTLKSDVQTKQTDKRRMPSAQQATLKRPNNQSLQTPVKKTSIKTKDNPTKNKFKAPSRTAPVQANNFNAKSKITKAIYKIRETGNGSTARAPKIEDIIKTTSVTKVLTNNKSLITDSSTVEHIIGDKEIIILSNINPNPEIDDKPFTVDCIVQSEQVGEKNGAVVVPIDEEVQTTIDQTMNENNQGRDTRQKFVNTSSKRKSRSLLTPKNTVISVPRQNPSRDNYVTYMNKGDVISLKLMIEIQNADKTVRKTHSLTNIYKHEKDSKANMEEEILIKSQMLESDVDNEILQSVLADSGNKVLVLQCDCSNENEINRNKTSLYTLPSEFSKKKYIVVVPKWEESTGIQNIENSRPRINSGFIPLKITISKISLETLAKTNSDNRPTWQDSTQSVKKQTTAVEKDTTFNRNISSAQVENNELHIENRRVTMTDDLVQNSKFDNQVTSKVKSKHENNGRVTDVIVSTTWDGNIVNKISSPSHVSYEFIPDPAVDTAHKISSEVSMQKSEYFMDKEDSLYALSNSIRYEDKFTQTELSDMVLEARIHEDGRYTFHLPSLRVLKYYDLAE